MEPQASPVCTDLVTIRPARSQMGPGGLPVGSGVSLRVRFGRSPGHVAQWESAAFTRQRSEVRYLPCPPSQHRRPGPVSAARGSRLSSCRELRRPRSGHTATRMPPVSLGSQAALHRPEEQSQGPHHAHHRQGDPDPCLANGVTDRCGLVDQPRARIALQGPAGVGHRVEAAPRTSGVPGFAAAVAATGQAGDRDPRLTACPGTDLPGTAHVTHRPDRDRPEDRHTEQHADHDQDHRSAPVTVAARAGREARRCRHRRRVPRRAGVRRAGRTPRGGR